jgi:hypothetical protein
VELPFEELCLLAADVTRSARVTIAKHNTNMQRIDIVAKSSGRPTYLDLKYAIPLVGPQNSVVLVADIAAHKDFKNHPMRETFPNLRCLAAYWLGEFDGEGHVLTFWNPSCDFFKHELIGKTVDHMVDIIRDLLANSHLKSVVAIPEQRSIPSEFAETQSSTEPTMRFLQETLLKKQRLLGRNGCAYLGLRQWRKPIKTYQIEALESLKMHSGSVDISGISAEMTKTIQSVYGKVFQHVVPIPGGSSGRREGLAAAVAKRVAQNLGIKYSDVLHSNPTPIGSSHPKKSAVLKPYKVEGEMLGNVVIIDDVATSGRHLELATLALRPLTSFCAAVVWIAD